MFTTMMFHSTYVVRSVARWPIPNRHITGQGHARTPQKSPQSHEKTQ
ncbi:hypothetical protein QX226_17205 [Vibrio vulnificus]|nr:hypothetical protein [Vibrio vulnificus]MDS1853756.1 hypothetical protein [Vibrio vulnificus]